MTMRSNRPGSSPYTRRDPAGARREAQQSQPTRARGTAEITKPRALVCTDDAQIRKSVAMAGFDVTVAADGESALPLLRHERWELVALERLPDRDIRAFLDKLFGERRREIFILKVDGHFKTGDRLQAWSESADLVLHPFELAQLPALFEESRQDKGDFYKNFRRAQRESSSRLGGQG